MKRYKLIEYITYTKKATFCAVKFYEFYNRTGNIAKQFKAFFLIGTKSELEKKFPFCYKDNCENRIKSGRL